MKLSFKMFLFLFAGILTLSILLTVTSFTLLAQLQNRNLELFQTELLGAGAEQMRYASDLFFNQLDQELQRYPDAPLPALMEQLYPKTGFICILHKDAPLPTDRPTLLTTNELHAAIHNAQLNRIYRLTKSNLAEYRSDTDEGIQPLIINYKACFRHDEWVLIGYGRSFNTLTDRLRFIRQRNERSLQRFLHLSAGIVLAGFTFLMFFHVLITRRLIFNPLRNLRLLLEDVARGRLHRRIPVTRSDEIGTLEASFNDMAEQLQQEMSTRRTAENTLNQLKDNLEEEVSRKTRDLEEAKAAAEAAAEAKGRFLANMSHELRTPLNAVMGFSSLLNKTTLDSEQRQFIAAIQQSSQLLLDLIHNILDHAKMEAGKLNLEHIAFNLEQLLEGLVEIMEPNARNRGVDLLLYYPPAMKKTFTGDPTRIRQILMNLISNAMKFTHSGTVLIHVSWRPPTQKTPGTVRLRVRDTGIGIPPEKQAGIFHSFVQGDDSTTRKYGGTGLGLSITRSLVEAMNGTITLKSSPGRGSLFTVDLPLEPAAERDPSGLPKHMKFTAVSLVDPNRKGYRLMRTLLTGYGLTVYPKTTSLTTCRRAEEVLLHAPPAAAPGIVLISPDLPDGSGTELMARLRTRAAYAQTIFIAIGSSIGLRKEEERCRAHFDGYLAHPVTGSKLRHILMRDVSEESAVLDVIEPGHEPDEPLSGLRILVAEDDSTSGMMMQIMLRKRGCEVTLADSGRAAVEAMRSRMFDLVFMDIMMPEMGGLEAAAYIRKHLDLTTPIIALTAATLTADEIRDAGISDCIPKPVADHHIESALEQWIYEKRTDTQMNPPAGGAS